jgi:hypothetical protein
MWGLMIFSLGNESRSKTDEIKTVINETLSITCLFTHSIYRKFKIIDDLINIRFEVIKAVFLKKEAW